MESSMGGQLILSSLTYDRSLVTSLDNLPARDLYPESLFDFHHDNDLDF